MRNSTTTLTRVADARPDRVARDQVRMVEAGELNRRPDAESTIGKVLVSPVKLGTSGDFPEDQDGPKMSQKDPNNPEKPDRVRSTRKRPGNS